jgi:RNA polymerase sigma-70 factor (sigma-E family)
MSADAWGPRIRAALVAACHPRDPVGASVPSMAVIGFLEPWHLSGAVPIGLARPADVAGTDRASTIDADALVIALYQQEGQSLVRLARIFVDDRNAAEDLVQEAFIRLARAAHRIQDPTKAAAYLRSIVLNLARDNNRRGLVSLRHHLPQDERRASTEDEIELQEDQQQVIDALRELPHRQRTALVLRYYEELGIDDIADAMGISRNSVKTHLKRGLAALEARLGTVEETVDESVTA